MSHREEDPSEDELVDEASMESFPASDPPPFWARSPKDRPRTTDEFRRPAGSNPS